MHVRFHNAESCRLHFAIWRLFCPKVPDILCDEKRGIRTYFMPESAILPATKAELQLDRKLSNLEESKPPMTSVKLLKTVWLIDEDVDIESDHCEPSSLAPEPTVIVASTSSPLPSPPHRTFLVSLILSSKFSQDKCYSKCLGKAIWITSQRNWMLRMHFGSGPGMVLARKQVLFLHLLDLVLLYGPRARVVSVSP